MEKNNVSKKVTATILSMSLLTVMAGAAIAPALGIIKAHFSSAPAMLVQFIVSMPALLIIVTNLFFLPLSRILRTRAIATTGLCSMLWLVLAASLWMTSTCYCSCEPSWVSASVLSCHSPQDFWPTISHQRNKQG